MSTRKVKSINFHSYDTDKLNSGCKYHLIPLFNMSIDDALSLKSELEKVPNIGGVISINLDNGNML